MRMRRRFGDWGGHTSFGFEVERMHNLHTDEYLTIDDYDKSHPNEDDNPDWEYVNVELNVSGSAYYTSSYTTGDPADCYPDDSGMEIEHIMFNNVDWTDNITKAELECIKDEIVDNCRNGGDCDY